MSTAINRSQGIVLDRVDAGERDALIDVYTADRGRVRFIARGVKDIKSKYASALLPGSWGEIAWTGGKRYDVFISADTASFLRVDTTVGHMTWSRAVLNTVRLLTREGESDMHILALCMQFVHDQTKSTLMHYMHFLTALLDVLGWHYDGDVTPQALYDFTVFHTGQQLKYLVK